MEITHQIGHRMLSFSSKAKNYHPIAIFHKLSGAIIGISRIKKYFRICYSEIDKIVANTALVQLKPDLD